VIFPISIILLVWNERRSARVNRALGDVSRNLLTVDPKNPQYNAVTAHMIGDLSTDEIVEDAVFGIRLNSPSLKRVVQVYQWEESKSSSSVNTAGGGKLTRTEYHYKMVWKDGLINSSSFKEPGHENNPSLFNSEHFLANNLFIDKQVILGPNASQKIRDIEHDALNMDHGIIDLVDFSIRNHTLLVDPYTLYIGRDPQDPEIGDMKVQFFKINSPEKISLIGYFQNGVIDQITTQDNENILLVKRGIHPPRVLIEGEMNSNNQLMWILRAAGWFLNWLSIIMAVQPFIVLSEFIPIFNTLISLGALFGSLIVSFIFTLITIVVSQPLTFKSKVVILTVISLFIWIISRN